MKSHRFSLVTLLRITSLLGGALLAFPEGASAGQQVREVHFIQQANYCNPPATYLQGQLAFFNPSAETVTVEVTGNLLYYISGGSPRQESQTVVVSIAPGQTSWYQLASAYAGYGCHGTMRFFGTIRITSTWGHVVASGNLMTTLPPGTTVVTNNVPFAVPLGR
jgi:hypothetical protein